MDKIEEFLENCISSGKVLTSDINEMNLTDDEVNIIEDILMRNNDTKAKKKIIKIIKNKK